MNMSRPRSIGEPHIVQRRRPRKYPWVYERCTTSPVNAPKCEACNKDASFTVRYEERPNQPQLSHLFLCGEHAARAKFSETFKQVLYDVDRKIDRGQNG